LLLAILLDKAAVDIWCDYHACSVLPDDAIWACDLVMLAEKWHFVERNKGLLLGVDLFMLTVGGRVAGQSYCLCAFVNARCLLLLELEILRL